MPPGSVMRRTSILLKQLVVWAHDVAGIHVGVHVGGGLGESGPGPTPPETRLRNAVTTMGPPFRTLDLRMTKALVPAKPPLREANSLTPM